MNSENSNSNLLEGWAWSKLGDLCWPPQYGWTTSADKHGRGLRLLRTTDISSGHVDWSTVPACRKEPDKAEKYLLSPGDIVVSRAGSVGLSFLIEECPPAIFASYLIRFCPIPPIRNKYVSLFMKSPHYWNSIVDRASGIAVPNVNATKLKELDFPLSPLAEQDRIVTKLEELLGSVQKTNNHLERVPQIVANFRKAVLDAACSGRLTKDWREKQPASKCTRTSSENNLLTEIEGFNFEIPKNWTIVSAEYVCNKITDGVHQTPKRRKEGRMLLSAKNIRSGYIDYENHDLISEDDFNRCLLRCNPEPGDVLIVSVGATIGRCSIVEKDAKFAIVRSVGLFKPNDLIRGKLLMYILQSPLLQKVIESVSQGTAQLCLYINRMKKLPIPLPPLEEQQETVRRVDRLFEFADNVEEWITQARERVVRLTQSILAKAFKGELVPTEAELARRQGRTYETAEQLLARVKLEREKKRTLEIKASEKIKIREKTMVVVRGPKKRPILEVLTEAQGKLKPEQLFRKAGFTEELVDDFYEELRAAVQAGQIKELRPNKTEIYLEVIKP